MFRNFTPLIMALAFAGLAMGCAPTMKMESGGFLSDYSKLEKVNDNYSRWKAPGWTKDSCVRLIVDPIQFDLDTTDKKEFSADDRREIREYAQKKFTAIIAKNREIVTQPGPGVCRVRLAFTDLEKSNALLNLYPMTRAAGAGRGGAAIQGELIDTESNKVVAMMTRRATGEFFEGGGVGSLSDIKTAIDVWSEDAEKKMDEWLFTS